MRLYKCKCGGSANPPFIAGVCEDSYKDLVVAIRNEIKSMFY